MYHIESIRDNTKIYCGLLEEDRAADNQWVLSLRFHVGIEDRLIATARKSVVGAPCEECVLSIPDLDYLAATEL